MNVYFENLFYKYNDKHVIEALRLYFIKIANDVNIF